MAAKRFKSKTDGWLLALIIFAMVTQMIGLSAAALQTTDPLVSTALLLVMIAVTGLIVWLIVGTHYTVDRNTLRIRSGPFRWTVPVDQITTVEPTRALWSSPALSLDRLRIRWGKRHWILISPADKAGFVRAIGHELNT